MNTSSREGYDLARSVPTKHQIVSNVALSLSSNWDGGGKGPLYLSRAKGSRVVLDELVQKHFRSGPFDPDANVCIAFSLWEHPDVPSRRLFMPNVDFEL